MAKLKGRRGRDLPLSDYTLEDGWWQRGDAKLGRPFLGGAIFRPTDLPVVIKQWLRRDVADDGVLREIWQDEIRQLNRLKGLPKAATASWISCGHRDSGMRDQADLIIRPSQGAPEAPQIEVIGALLAKKMKSIGASCQAQPGSPCRQCE